MGMEASWFERHRRTLLFVALGALLLAIFVISAVYG
jgi:hypothetical protein